jgi:hexosaminidase
MTPTSHSYFDYGYDSISTQRVFEWSVIPKELEGNQREMVLGGQANIWTEWIVDRDRLDRMTWPRMIAMAEVLWSGPGGKWPDFEKRLRSQCARLDEQGVAYYLEEPKIPAKLYFGNDPVVLNSADFEEPVLYSTDSNAPLGAWKPLKRVAIPKDQPVYFSYARKDAKGKIRAGDIAEVLHCTKWLDQNLEVSQQFEMSFYNGKFSKISEFENKPPDQRRWVAGINKASFIQPNNFGARYRAVVRLPGGLTKFHLSSDDGSIFKLNGVTVINHDGLHAGSTKSAGVMLKAGVYELEVLYFEAGGGSVLSLEMENENGIRKEVMLAGLS